MKINNLFKNQIWLFISITLILLSSSCKTHLKNSAPIKNKIENEDTILRKDGFVVDCGSGCAIVYNIKKINIEGEIYKVKFKVSNYIDEKITHEYYKAYIFEFEKDGKLINIHLKGTEENILLDNDIIMKNNMKKLGERLWDYESSKKP